MFVDGYDVILADTPSAVLKRFKDSSSRIFFSTEVLCGPDKSVAEQYPKVNGPYRYLNSGAFIAYAADLYKLITLKPVADTDDDQGYFTTIYLNQTLRSQMNFKIDANCTLFQSLFASESHIRIVPLYDDSKIINTVHQTNPVILHGNGWPKLKLSAAGNYIAKSWTVGGGCLACAENKIDVFDNGLPDGDILMGVFIEQPTPFIDQFFERLLHLSYPKSKIHLRIHNGVPYHSDHVREFVSSLNIGADECENVVKNDDSCLAVKKVTSERYVYKSVEVLGKDQEPAVEDQKRTKQVLPFTESTARAFIM